MEKFMKKMGAWLVAYFTATVCAGIFRVMDFPIGLVFVFICIIIGMLVFLSILNLPEEKEAVTERGTMFKQYVDEIEADKAPLGSDKLGKINLLLRLKKLLLKRGEAEEKILGIYIKYRKYKEAKV